MFNFSHDRPLERDPRDRGGDRDGLPGLLPQEVLPDQELLQGLNFVSERIPYLSYMLSRRKYDIASEMRAYSTFQFDFRAKTLDVMRTSLWSKRGCSEPLFPYSTAFAVPAPSATARAGHAVLSLLIAD